MQSVFLFYDKASGPQARLAFSKKYKHCNALCFDGTHWILTEFGGTGITNRVIKINDINSFIDKAPSLIPELTAIISVDIDDRDTNGWSPLWIKSCNELCRYVSGVDIGRTFNPAHMYYKLIDKDEVTNYIINYAWSRENGIIWRRG